MNLQVGVKALIEHNGEYLFLRRSKDFKAGAQAWDIPGGRIEASEPLYDALAREVFEETGLRVDSVHTLLAAQDIFVPEKDLRVVRLTYAVNASGEIRLSSEHDEYRWMSARAVLDSPNLDEYVREVLQTHTSRA